MNQNTQERFLGWWNQRNIGSPLMRVVARKEYLSQPLELCCPARTAESAHTDVIEISKHVRNLLKSHDFLADAYASLDLNLGPGSMALYLGTEPDFRWDTIWFKEWVHETWNDVPTFKFDPENYWFCRHLDLIRTAKLLADNQYLINIPDIIENIDVLSAMRGPQNLCYDLFDAPDEIHARIACLDHLYFKYYDAFYDITKNADNSSTFTAFNIWGAGKTGKIQCDFCALMSPKQFRDFILSSITRQCQNLQQSMFHLDGPDAIKHLDALLEIKELNAVQWSHGAGHPDGISDCWFEPIYDKIRAADKSLVLFIEDGTVETWIPKIDCLIERYGTAGVYLEFPVMSQSDADLLLTHCAKFWK